jgi:adhesin HecA-like repeat protein
MILTRSLAFVFFTLATFSLAHAQLTNDDATIVIESGATLVVEGTITNNGGVVPIGELFIQGPGIPNVMFDFGNGVQQATGIINSGTIEVTGDFDNDAGFTPTDDFLYLKFDAALSSDLDLGDIFPMNLSQSQIDAAYLAQISEFAASNPTPITIPIVVVPEPSCISLVLLGVLLAVGYRRCL